MSLKGWIAQHGRAKAQAFRAPVPLAVGTDVFTLQNGLPFWFAVAVDAPGWYWFEPDGKQARVDRAALPHEYLADLAQLPAFYAVAAYQMAAGVWCCVPRFAADADQRGWAAGHPRPVYLVRHALQALDVIIVRRLGSVLLYEKVATTIDSSVAHRAGLALANDSWVPAMDIDLMNASGVADAYFAERKRRVLEEQARIARLADAERKRALLTTTEGKLRHELEFVGAELVNWTDLGEALNVTWTFGGRTATMRVNHDMRIRVAGICLSGTDGQYTLASIVPVMEEAVRQRRFDLPASYGGTRQASSSYDEDDD